MPTTTPDRTPLLAAFACPECKVRLGGSDDRLACPGGHEFPIVRGVARFVGSDAYAASFSFEWLTHRTTQLDSARADRMTEDTLRRKTALSPEDVAGKLVLDAGVGTGRFSEVLSRWGARVIGIDLSLAVDAARDNLAGNENVAIAQADILRPPLAPETFDVIISIGVLHRTPDTRRSFEALVPLLKPAGTICVWVYPDDPDFVTRKHWIPFTSRIPPQMFYEWCRWFVPLMRRPQGRLARWIGSVFPYREQEFGLENDILDTFDGFSPRYHHVHAPEEVELWFRESGLLDVRRLEPRTAVRGARPPTGVGRGASGPAGTGPG